MKSMTKKITATALFGVLAVSAFAGCVSALSRLVKPSLRQAAFSCPNDADGPASQRLTSAFGRDMMASGERRPGIS